MFNKTLGILHFYIIYPYCQMVRHRILIPAFTGSNPVRGVANKAQIKKEDIGMSKENLEKLTVKELAEKCKELGLPRYHGKKMLTKQELIESLLNTNSPQESNENAQQIERSCECSCECEKCSEDKVVEEKPEWINQDKEKYIEEAEVGTLIAFYDKKKKPRTAALVNRSSSRRVIKVITEFGWEFIVPYEDVLWVRKGTRWPKGVYNLLKGYNNGK